jgi:phosphoserine phosphatase RsbU/P
MLLPGLIMNKPGQQQSTRLFLLDYALFTGTGIAVGLFNFLALGVSVVSGIEIAIGFATAGLIPALDLSLEWEYRLIRQAKITSPDHNLRQSFVPQTRKFALMACGIIIFVTIVLVLLVWRDIAWLMDQSPSDTSLPWLLRAIILDVLYVMGILLGLTVILVFSYARNLKLLFSNQTAVLELVSRGHFETKVPVATNDEFALIAEHTNTMIDHLVERERMSKGLELARQIQANLLPRSSPLLPGVQVFGASVFSEETGGDFYDFTARGEQGDTELLLLIGDVTGHGVGSALLMASIRAYIKAHLHQIVDLAEIMNRTNILLCEDTAGSGYFATVFLLAYAPHTRQARWVSAGHDPAVFLEDTRNTPKELTGHDIPLGVDPRWSYTVFSEQLKPGIVFLGTDGLWETTSTNTTMFGKQRLLQVLLAQQQEIPEKIVSTILAEVEHFSAQGRAEDDRTAVVARFR